MRNSPDTQTRCFVVIFVLGAPGAGKGTLCAHLAQQHRLSHFSVGDRLRAWMRANRTAPLAARIEEKLAHQGFLTSAELDPFLATAIQDARLAEGVRGILIDGFPRCVEQLAAWTPGPAQEHLSQAASHTGPDIVLSLHVDRDKAKQRYLARGRDHNDTAEKFERRFTEYAEEGPPVERHYENAGLLHRIDVNGPKDENIRHLTEVLEQSQVWNNAIKEI